jgi:hypothetical protein
MMQRKDGLMKQRRTVSVVLAAVLLCTGAGRWAQAQMAVEPPTGGGGNVPIAPPTDSAPAATQTQPAPATESISEETRVLQQMLNAGTIPGISGGGLVLPPGPEPGASGLLREGQVIDLRAGRLKRDENGHMLFEFDPKESPAYPPMEVIPSRRLEAMENAADFVPGRTPKDMTFRIAAEVTEYRGKNYLYIKPSALPMPGTPAATLPAESAAPEPLVNAVAPKAPPIVAMTENSVISNRIGRLVRDPKTGAKLIAFDADGRRMADPPMGVVPCKYLAVLEEATEDGNKPLKFKLSGEVTTYRGRNYLYLKYVGVVPDLSEGIGAGSNVGG